MVEPPRHADAPPSIPIADRDDSTVDRCDVIDLSTDVGFELDEKARAVLGLSTPASLATATATMFTMLA